MAIPVIAVSAVDGAVTRSSSQRAKSVAVAETMEKTQAEENLTVANVLPFF